MCRARVHSIVGKAAEMFGRPLLATVLVVTLVPGGARAHTAPTDPTNVPAAVLVLEGDDTEAAHTSTQRLRTALAQRGYASDYTATTAELSLALDCGKFDSACAGKAATELGVDKIFYGTLQAKPPKLSVVMFDAESGVVTGEVHLPMAGMSVADQEAAVDEAVRTLLPRDDDDVLPAPTEAAPIQPRQDAVPRSSGERKYVWGPYKPRPVWKKALLGTSVGMAVVGLGLGLIGIPATQSGRKRGSLYDDLLEAANASLTDDNPVNDVDPETVDDLCSDKPGSGGALEEVQPEGTGAQTGIRNREVAEVCQRGRAIAFVSTFGWGMFAAGVLGTAVMTTLFFVRKNPNAAAWQRRGVYVGATPTRRGATVSGGFRF